MFPDKKKKNGLDGMHFIFIYSVFINNLHWCWRSPLAASLWQLAPLTTNHWTATLIPGVKRDLNRQPLSHWANRSTWSPLAHSHFCSCWQKAQKVHGITATWPAPRGSVPHVPLWNHMALPPLSFKEVKGCEWDEAEWTQPEKEK